jgi:hypothetical protein
MRAFAQRSYGLTRYRLNLGNLTLAEIAGGEFLKIRT